MLTCKKCGGTDFFMHEYGYSHPQRYDGISEYKCKVCGTTYGRWTGNIIPEGFHEPRLGEWIVYKVCVQHENGELYSACSAGYDRLWKVHYPINDWARPYKGQGKLYCYETFRQALHGGFSGMLVKCIGEGITPGEHYKTHNKGAYYEGLGREFEFGELRADALKVIRVYGHTNDLKGDMVG